VQGLCQLGRKIFSRPRVAIENGLSLPQLDAAPDIVAETLHMLSGLAGAAAIR
jgi:hypothetical protein